MAEITGSFYGTDRSDEEKKLCEVQKIAEDKIEAVRAEVAGLKNELMELKDVYDADDKEGLAQWFYKDARFGEVRKDLLRAERARKKPFFGRIDFEDESVGKRETYYIGKTIIAKDPHKPIVIDWRAPIASVYYDSSLGICKYKVPHEGILQVDLKRKRTYEIEDDRIKDYYDSDIVANDDLLTKYLSKSRRSVLSEIIATIQSEQNYVIRKNPRHNVVIQGSAGSGKTTVAMHRISYILYNYELEFKPESFYIVGSNKVLLDYITGVLPDLDVYGVSQMTMENLFTRLLYEDWTDRKYTVKHFDKTDKNIGIKGSGKWFDALEEYCRNYEHDYVPMEDVCIEKNNHVILKASEIEKTLKEFGSRSLKDKFDRLSDLLMSHLETELYGRYYSYNVEEQKKLIQHYKRYFERMYLKDSVWDIYKAFFLGMQKVYPTVQYTEGEPDLYDLAAAAYIYKRLKETEVIQEASHVIIDEAQDFGIAAYRALKYCMSKCTFTIMGDVAQNINLSTGLSDWEELKKVMLPEKYDYFGLLRKSYRNTVEISNFATDILRHGTFPIYPVEPVIRHGENVRTIGVEDDEELVSEILDRLEKMEREQYETIAVICRDEAETSKLFKALKQYKKVSRFTESDTTLKSGITVLPIEYSKGLEFDAVIIADASAEKYPKEDGYARLLYVATTRALHELTVFYKGDLTALISDPIPKERLEFDFVKDDFHEDPFEFEEEFITMEEAAKKLSLEGDDELKLREKYGPKRIVVNKPVAAKPATIAKPVAAKPMEKGVAVSLHNTSAVKPLPKAISPGKSTNDFWHAPDGTSLAPLGHGRINNAIKWIRADKSKVELTGAYGVLRVEPVTDNTVKIIFSKDSFSESRKTPSEIELPENVKWNCMEGRDDVRIVMGKMTVRIDKRSGIMSFMDTKGVIFLKEQDLVQRQFHTSQPVAWQYFEWTKKENLSVRGIKDNEWLDFSTPTAKIISHPEEENRTTLIMSNKAYQILIPSGIKAMVCTIAAFGPYLQYMNTNQIEYYVRYAR